ncbi:type II cytosine-specific DNA methyltransferase [Campylobacter blaseri]|uniref:Cytosine-specific methyltransferase n=1 Tax=Campylobacter blaseri TaxID=2042961 RepID=A0A2P8R095_9BACT|nr:DNA cytosine methyltransferase [Campylobacter blaseri]PSM51916.1 DNA (cytosine-5-)-methyltransferase [Campylobacter blaseri]PSM53700.1 DNA (cytosine-5-)-methyltransferase [Campylobacter blaseri]QKF85746.1 type II cytosine-specific DNA methyltransferase [Campylobacter blaseri]
MKKINVIDLFSGVGGLSYGFSIDSNFSILLANEIEPNTAKSYSLNHPGVVMLNKDIKEIDKMELLCHLNNKNVDIIIGGPPCQSYSTLGKRQMDSRANLFTEYCRILSILKPKIFIFENVKGLLSMQNGKLILKIKNEFEKLGYDVKYQILNALKYGVPQDRERVIIVGTFEKNTFEFPQATYGEGLKPYITVNEAIGDLDYLESGGSSNKYLKEADNDFLKFVRKAKYSLTEHKAPKNNLHLIKIMKTLKDGETKDMLPENIRPKSGYGNTYAKLWWNRPSTTITRNFACPSSSRCIHPRDSRAMSIREGARLQSFPDDYQFYGSDSIKRLQIGNAVPPLLSIAISNQVKKYFKN